MTKSAKTSLLRMKIADIEETDILAIGRDGLFRNILTDHL